MKVRVCRVPLEVLRFIEAEAGAHLPNESGGILIGQFSDDVVLITRAGDAGPNAYHAPVGFRRDGEHAQQLRDRAVAASGGRDDYVGEWHSHPTDALPSPKDRRSMRAISADRKFALAEPVLIVLCRTSVGMWEPTAYQTCGTRCVSLHFEVVTEASEAEPDARRVNVSGA